MQFGCKNRLLLRLFVLLLAFLLENDYNLAFSLEMDPIDEENNNDTSDDDQDGNNLPQLPEHHITEEQLVIVSGTLFFLFVMFFVFGVPVKVGTTLVTNVIMNKFVGFILFLFLSSIFDSSYFNMCYFFNYNYANMLFFSGLSTGLYILF